MSVRMMDGYGSTWLQSINLRKKDCDWCYTPAEYVITELSTRIHTPEGRAWEDRCCTHHRDKWFPVNPVAVDLVRRCEALRCNEEARRYVAGSLATGKLFGFTVCTVHRGPAAIPGTTFVAPRAWFREYVWSERAENAGWVA